MAIEDDFYNGRRISYDGALCTIKRKVDYIPNTRGKWLGVEWDDPTRGKHNGALNGKTYFICRSHQPTVASFVRPTRQSDPTRTVLEAIKHKYVVDQSQTKPAEKVVISGKVAEEIGFDKITEKQSVLANLKVVILDHMVISGIAPKESSEEAIQAAIQKLETTCPNAVELDLSHNPIERWVDIEDICTALPRLRVLKLSSIRLRKLDSHSRDGVSNCFQYVQELHLNECLFTPGEVVELLNTPNGPRFPALQSLWLSQNELYDFRIPSEQLNKTVLSVKTLMLENNFFTSLTPLSTLLAMFPGTTHLSLQSNEISTITTQPSKPYVQITSLNLSQNEINSFTSIDALPTLFPNLTSLRISKNPVYTTQTSASPANAADTAYYLTLARISTLKTLNYTDITQRERDDGEIYYLSIAEKEIRTTLTSNLDPSTRADSIPDLTKNYPRYTQLCIHHDRENLITQLTDSTTPPTQSTKQTHPPGSLASRLVTTIFHLNPQVEFTRALPTTLPTRSIYALVARTLNLEPLTFKLVYESNELDPVRDDFTTRSQIVGIARLKGEKRWDGWGDWDADALVEADVDKNGDGVGDGDEGKVEGRWEGDVFVKDGRKWRKREVDVLFGVRRWGDWLDDGVESCRVRVEVVGRKKVGGLDLKKTGG